MKLNNKTGMFIFKIEVLLRMLNVQKQSKEKISKLLINLLKPTGFLHQQF